MEVKKAKSLVEDIMDICSQFGEENLTEACSGIYNDLSKCNSVEHVIDCARELMVFVSEAPWEECEMGDLKNEIEEIFNELIEESEEF